MAAADVVITMMRMRVLVGDSGWGTRISGFQPPSTDIAMPLTLLASLHASHEMAVAISSALAVRSPSAMPTNWRSNAHGTVGAAVVAMFVSVPPGHTALQRMPCGL